MSIAKSIAFFLQNPFLAFSVPETERKAFKNRIKVLSPFVGSDTTNEGRSLAEGINSLRYLGLSMICQGGVPPGRIVHHLDLSI